LHKFPTKRQFLLVTKSLGHILSFRHDQQAIEDSVFIAAFQLVLNKAECALCGSS